MQSTPRIDRHLLGAILILAGLVCYLNSFQIPFLFDDVVSVLDNPSIKDISSMHWAIPRGSSTVGGRPLTNLSFAVDYLLGGLSPTAYHVTNLVIHLFSGLVIFAWLRGLFGKIDSAKKMPADYLAFSCALIWICLPVSTYAVSYISQRSEILMSLCYLLSIYSFWRWRSEDSNERWPYISVGMCFCGVMCKEGIATVPLMILLLDRTFFSGTFKNAIRSNAKYYIALASSWIVLAVFFIHASGRGVGLDGGVSPFKYAITEARVVLTYLKLVFYPFPLVFDYAYTVYRRNVEEVPYIIALVFLVALTLWLVWKRPVTGFFAAWFFILLAPTSSVIPIASQPMGENRVYLAALGPVVLALIIGYRYIRSLLWLLVGAACCFYIHVAQSRNQQCSSAINIWLDTIAKAPKNPRAYCNLGIIFAHDSRLDEADRMMDKAIALNPNWAEPLANKGDIALRRGKPAIAQIWLERALEHSPGTCEMWRNLGAVFTDEKEPAAAEKAFRTALSIQPDDPLALTGLGNVYLNRKDYPNAMKYLALAIESNPDMAICHNNLGYAYLQTNNPEKALEEFEIAVHLNPDLAKPQSNLGTMLARSRKYNDAIWHFLYALRLAPNDVETWVNLGLAYQLSGRSGIAEECYREALRRDPSDERAKSYLATITGKSEGQRADQSGSRL